MDTFHIREAERMTLLVLPTRSTDRHFCPRAQLPLLQHRAWHCRRAPNPCECCGRRTRHLEGLSNATEIRHPCPEIVHRSAPNFDALILPILNYLLYCSHCWGCVEVHRGWLESGVRIEMHSCNLHSTMYLRLYPLSAAGHTAREKANFKFSSRLQLSNEISPMSDKDSCQEFR
jgi:hypothetical protein